MNAIPKKLFVRSALLLVLVIAGAFLFRAWLGSTVELSADAQTRLARLGEDQLSVRAQKVVGGLENPWGMAFLPDGRIFINEKKGVIRVVQNGELLSKPVAGVPKVYNRGQGGLLDIALHPDFERNKLLFLSFSKPAPGGGNTAIARAKLSGNLLKRIKIIYEAKPATTKGVHFGSRLAFDDEKRLYFTIGDRGARDKNPQDITRDGGKVYRINTDGSIPKDNPFLHKTDVKKAIYSYGHRNPQGLVFNPENGTLWLHEHGPRGGDELNVVKPGLNYGWPVISYGINYDGSTLTELTEKEGMEQPESFWTPSIAPCGMTFVTSQRYPKWKGDLLLGSLKFNHLVRVDLEGDRVLKHEIVAQGIGRVRNVKQAPDGYLYVGVQGRGLFRLIPKSS